MKKIFSLAVACCLVAAASAQQKVKATIDPERFSEVKQVSELTKKNMFAKGEKPNKVAAGATAPDTVFYGLPENAFYQGWSPEGMSYYGSYIIASIEDSLVFENLSIKHNNYTYGWTINDDEPRISDTLVYWTPGATGLKADGTYYMPELLNSNGDNYMFGADDEDGTYIWASPQDYVGMTSIDLDDPTIKLYGWSGNTDYFMGTGMINGTDTLDTYVVFFGTPNAEMAIDTISLYWWSRSATPIPAGQALTMMLFDETTGSVIGRYNATANDIAWQQANQAGTVHFGQLSFPIKANINGKVSAYLTGFNRPGVSIGCMTDDNPLRDDYYPTFFVYKKQYLRSFGNNIALFFNAKFGHDATAVENVAKDVKVEKLIENGQVVIMKGNKKYNVLGAEL